MLSLSLIIQTKVNVRMLQIVWLMEYIRQTDVFRIMMKMFYPKVHFFSYGPVSISDKTSYYKTS